MPIPAGPVGHAAQPPKAEGFAAGTGLQAEARGLRWQFLDLCPRGGVVGGGRIDSVSTGGLGRGGPGEFGDAGLGFESERRWGLERVFQQAGVPQQVGQSGIDRGIAIGRIGEQGVDRCPGVNPVGDPRREGVGGAGQQHRVLGGEAGPQEVFAVAAVPLAEEGAEGEEEGDSWDISRPFPGDILGEVAVAGLCRPRHPQDPEVRVVGLETPADGRSVLE